MIRILSLVAGCWLLATGSLAQTVSQKLQKVFWAFEKDSQLKYAISSLYVIDAATGQVIFDKNSRVGLAPASTQKIITSVTAFELLGKDYRYKTEFGIGSDPLKDMALWINPSGDPTFGSWRWESTKEKNILNKLVVKDSKPGDITKYTSIIINDIGWNSEQIPDGWIWQDIGNYYGAGASKFNWRENQFDLILKSGDKIGDTVTIVATDPPLYSYPIVSVAISVGKGSGDNAYIFLPSSQSSAIVRGTIPVNENSFKISGINCQSDWTIFKNA